MTVEIVLLFAIALAAFGCVASYNAARHRVLAQLATACKKVTLIRGRALADNADASAGAAWAVAEVYAQVDKAPHFLLSTRAALNITARDVEAV